MYRGINECVGVAVVFMSEKDCTGVYISEGECTGVNISKLYRCL